MILYHAGETMILYHVGSGLEFDAVGSRVPRSRKWYSRRFMKILVKLRKRWHKVNKRPGKWRDPLL